MPIEYLWSSVVSDPETFETTTTGSYRRSGLRRPDLYTDIIDGPRRASLVARDCEGESLGNNTPEANLIAAQKREEAWNELY